MTRLSFRRLFAAAALGFTAAVVTPAFAADYANPQLIIDAEGLNAKVGDAGMVIIDVRPAEDFVAGHIPGARQLDPNAVVDPDAPIEGALLPTEDLVHLLGELGVSAGSQVVLYDDNGGFHAARMFWLLEYHGHRNVSVLDGGLNAWVEAGNPLDQGEASPVMPANYAVALSPRRLATADWIMERRDDDNTIVIDVRPESAFNKGHIPWARNIPWKGNLAADGTMKSADDLRAHFASHGITDTQNIVVHCQVGLASSHSYFALRLLGYPQVRTYHRSWAEWGTSDDLPKAAINQG